VTEEEVGLFKVEQVVERMDITPEGVFARVMEIVARTRSGVRFPVEIPKIKFTPELADKLLTEEAEKIERVLSMRK